MTDDEILAQIADGVRRRPGVTAPLIASLDRAEAEDATDETLDAVAADLGLDAATTRRALRLYGSDFQESVLARVLAEQVGKVADKRPLKLVDPISTSKKPHLRSVFAGAATALALAASVVLWVSSREHADALPGYALSTTGGDKDFRGNGAPSDVRVHKDSTLTLTMRPLGTVHGGVEARIAIAKDNAARVWSGAIEMSPEGSVRLRADANALFPEGPGGFDLVVVVGRAGTVPTDANVLARSREDEPIGVRVGHVHVEVVSDR